MKANPAPARKTHRTRHRLTEFLRSAWHHGWLKGLLLGIAVGAAYSPMWHAGFIWDDDAYVTRNATLRDGHGLWRIWFDVMATPQYYPLVHSSFWLEYHLWGLNPLGYHLINVLLHVLAAILLWRVLGRLQLPGAWLAAAVFALHPIGVESVAWVTERKNVLSTVFYFGAALAYLRFAGVEGACRQGRWKWYAAALALFVAALWSKTVTCSLPAALLLVCWWKKGRLQRTDVLPLLPFFVIGAGLGLLTVWLERHHVGAQGAEWSLTFPQRCLVAGRALWFYAAKLFWPANLTFIYPRWVIDATVWRQWLFPIAAVGLVAALWRMRHRFGRGPLVAVLFFAGTVSPALGFVDVYPFRYSFVADHFQYLAAVGLIVLAAEGVKRLPRALAVGLLIGLGALTCQRTGAYRDLETLWRDTLAKNPDCWIAHNNLGLELQRQNRLDEAIEEYTKAQRVEPTYAETYNNLANVLARQHRLEEAMANYRRAIELNPNYIESMNGLGVCLAMSGTYGEAISLFDRVLRLDPNYVRARINLGNTAQSQHQLEEAIEHYTRALRLAPRDAVVHNNLGLVLEEKGLLTEAAAHYREAVAINSADATAHFRLGRALAQLGLEAEATAHVSEALRLRAGFPEALQLLEALQAPPAK